MSTHERCPGARAQVNDGPCVTYVGPGGAGNFVKMVHNGIEYGDMQLISEAYDVLKTVGGLSNEELVAAFNEWNAVRTARPPLFTCMPPCVCRPVSLLQHGNTATNPACCRGRPCMLLGAPASNWLAPTEPPTSAAGNCMRRCRMQEGWHAQCHQCWGLGAVEKVEQNELPGRGWALSYHPALRRNTC